MSVNDPGKVDYLRYELAEVYCKKLYKNITT